MGLNPFIGQSQTQLETWLRAAQADLAAGKTVSSAGAGDSNMSNQVDLDPKTRVELLLRALNILDPVTYPSTSIRRVTRTKVRVYPHEDTSQFATDQ